MEYQDILYETDGPVAIIRLNRPRYRNAQSWGLLDELDAALDRAAKSKDVKVAIVCGAGDHFSSGHDIGTPEQLAAQEEVGTWGRRWYDAFRHYNLDITLRWHHLPLPTIAMVHGYCIYGGWMIANAMDLIFAAEDSLFLAGLVEYFSVPWDVGPRAAKELLFESRFISAEEAKELGMVSRVYPRAELERETLAYAHRVAENDSMLLRMAKLSVNKMLDAQGYSNTMESAFHDYWARANPGRPGPDVDPEPWRTGERRLPGVALALRRLREAQESEE
jgi:enoyl-CoA hydratase